MKKRKIFYDILQLYDWQMKINTISSFAPPIFQESWLEFFRPISFSAPVRAVQTSLTVYNSAQLNDSVINEYRLCLVVSARLQVQ